MANRKSSTGSQEDSAQQRPALEPPQFTLSTLMWGVAGLSILFAAMTAAGPIGGFALLLLALAIVAHISGNAIGTQLRTIGSEPIDDIESSQRRRAPRDPSHTSIPASNLSQCGAVSRTMLLFTISGASLFGVSGAALLIWLAWGELNLPTAIVAIISPTVLGGLLGFAISSFTQTAGGAWLEASDTHRRERIARVTAHTDVPQR